MRFIIIITLVAAGESGAHCSRNSTEFIVVHVMYKKKKKIVKTIIICALGTRKDSAAYYTRIPAVIFRRKLIIFSVPL